MCTSVQALLGTMERIFHVSERSKQIKCSDLVFGGLCVVLVGDSVHLPSILAKRLLVEGLPSTNIDDRIGHTICGQFSEVVILKENTQFDETDLERVVFNNLLGLMREGKVAEDVRETLISRCSMMMIEYLVFFVIAGM